MKILGHYCFKNLDIFKTRFFNIDKNLNWCYHPFRSFTSDHRLHLPTRSNLLHLPAVKKNQIVKKQMFPERVPNLICQQLLSQLLCAPQPQFSQLLKALQESLPNQASSLSHPFFIHFSACFGTFFRNNLQFRDGETFSFLQNSLSLGKIS